MCVYLSVTRRYCVKTAKLRITQTTPRDSPGTLVFWRQKSLVGDAPCPLKFALKVAHPLSNTTQQFWQISVHSASAMRASKNVQLALIRSRPRAFKRAIDEPFTLPEGAPKGGTKRDFAVFASTIQLLFKEVCCKVSMCETFQRQSCIVTSFLYVTVHGWIAGDVPIYLKFALKVTHSFDLPMWPSGLRTWPPCAVEPWRAQWPRFAPQPVRIFANIRRISIEPEILRCYWLLVVYTSVYFSRFINSFTRWRHITQPKYYH